MSPVLCSIDTSQLSPVLCSIDTSQLSPVLCSIWTFGHLDMWGRPSSDVLDRVTLTLTPSFLLSAASFSAAAVGGCPVPVVVDLRAHSLLRVDVLWVRV